MDVNNMKYITMNKTISDKILYIINKRIYRVTIEEA